MAQPFIAEIRIWGTTFNPLGWLDCNGGLVPIQQQSALFALIGTFYGGDGRSTFALPTLNNRVPMHFGTGLGLTPRLLGHSYGTPTVSLTSNQIPSHSHTVSGYPQKGDTGTPTGNRLAFDFGGQTEILRYMAPPDANMVSMSMSALGVNGDSQPHENCQPTLAMRFCIATVGLFPSRS